MARGRPPTPIEKLRATQRDANHKADGREIVRIEVTPDRTVPVLISSTITGRGAEEWERVWLAGYWLKRDQDYHWVEMIAQAYSDIEGFRERVKADGLVQKGSLGQPVAHPLIAEIRKAEKLVQDCLSKLGFSPTDRAKLHLAEVKVANELQQMLQEERKGVGR